MIRLSTKLIRLQKYSKYPKYLSRVTYNFSQNSQKQKKQTSQKVLQPPEQKGISIRDFVNWSTGIGKTFIDQTRKFRWYNWTLIALLGGTAFYYLQPKQQLYPITLFQDDIMKLNDKQDTSHPQRMFNNVTIITCVLPEKINYKIKFIQNDKQYTVNYYGETNKFKEIQKILQNNSNRINLTYKYQPNIQVKSSKLQLLSRILGSIFIGFYILRTQNISKIKKHTKSSTNFSSILGQKKSFEIINKTKVKFKDVAGLDQSKIQIQQFVDFLKNPQRYKKLGARIPKGVLLSGPPGTGKTMLAKACAGEAGVPFIPVSGSDFVQIFVGVGASRVRDLFATAKQNAPAIIFIDEIDAVGRKRSGSHGSHDQRDNTLNQILVQMDGFQTSKNVIVMAATNRQNLLDLALIRPGRFDRLVEVNLPDLQGRRQIFNVHLTKIKTLKSRSKQDYARRLATLTPGFSGAQIANLCNQAAILAARNGKNQVDGHDFQMAAQRIIGGIQRKSIITKQQKHVVAVHESGHAVASWFLQGADPLLKLTIIPRSKGSLGFAQYFVSENKLQTKKQIVHRICFILGGRCAEELVFGKITNGAADDLKKAYQLAYSYVVKLGMSQQLGLLAYKDPQYLRPYSQQMAQKIDKSIKKILEECTQISKKLIKQHEHHLKQLSDYLYQKQTLTIKQIRKILGQRDFTNNQTYQKYLEIEKELDGVKV